MLEQVEYDTLEKEDLVRVFIKGGISSPGDLLKIIQVAEELNVEHLHFGSRQDILFASPNIPRNTLKETFESIKTTFDCDGESYQNIVTSYVALDVIPSTSWVAAHTYHYILDTFDFQPKLKINITDPAQTMVPLFTGQLNFIAAEKEGYWHLYIREQEQGEILWECPNLIYNYDIAKVVKTFENEYTIGIPIESTKVWNTIISTLDINTISINKKLTLPSGPFPYYEGMHRMISGKYWLGLYWRNNKFDIPFLKELCELCLKTNIGKITLTPWKSFIVKGIDSKNIINWEKLLGKFGINVRHSSLELNWHLPVLDQEALELKNFLVRALDKQDISTYGLTFTIKTKPIILFTSVVIESIPSSNNDMYNVLYAKDFNCNEPKYTTFVKRVPKEAIPPILIELSHLYYEQLDNSNYGDDKPKKLNATSVIEKVYQCQSCLSIYDESIGMPDEGIPQNTKFESLPSSFTCPLCDANKNEFTEVEMPR
ncbi:rubredoxin domain-containing protein [Flammeovirga pectinis]|uniref:Rubredoxin domain-containing protein n=1 Tax=Flammeovirga pectinis TaxID=2494373 RepID=A0A3S9P333_9BACT|nr:rubredoxin domain-containing protein [Flammeovirga pectinis]AZQ62620.1 rubredoxin domain-containing protein [Flammeovirga pectinis]